MLLKKDQASPNLSKFFDKSILDAIRDEVISKFNIQFDVLPADIEQRLKAIMKVILFSFRKINLH